MSGNLTAELKLLETSFPSITWTYATNGDCRIYTGKVLDVIVVTVFMPERHLTGAEAEVNFLLHNDTMFSIDQFRDALGKFFEHAEHYVKRNYIEQKREIIYGERHY